MFQFTLKTALDMMIFNGKTRDRTESGLDEEKKSFQLISVTLYQVKTIWCLIPNSDVEDTLYCIDFIYAHHIATIKEKKT